jgi:hypothetical protein
LRVLPDATAANAHESGEIYERCMMEFGRSDQTWCHEKWRGTVYAMRASTVLKCSTPFANTSDCPIALPIR